MLDRRTYSQDMSQFFKGFEGNVLKFCAYYIESKLGKNNTLKPMPEFFEAFESFYEKVFYYYIGCNYFCTCDVCCHTGRQIRRLL